jgi:hypothetical protein
MPGVSTERAGGNSNPPFTSGDSPSGDSFSGADALEGEARRAQALRRVAAEAAGELVGAFEE